MQPSWIPRNVELSIPLSPAAAGWGIFIQLNPGVPLRSTPGSMLAPAPQAEAELHLFRQIRRFKSSDLSRSNIQSLAKGFAFQRSRNFQAKEGSL